MPSIKSATVTLLASLALFVAVAEDTAAGEDPRVLIAGELKGVEPEDVNPSPIDGVWEVAVGPHLIYVTEDAKYLVKGEIIKLEGYVNITEMRRSKARLEALREIDESRMIVFSPPGETRVTLTVFTDIDCPYCRKLHQEMAELNALGVEVRYLLYPRTGPGSASWNKADAVWCSHDRNKDLTLAKSSDSNWPGTEPAECAGSPVHEHWELGQLVNFRGTPAIITDTGQMFTGYLPAPQLLEYALALDAQAGAE